MTVPSNAELSDRLHLEDVTVHMRLSKSLWEQALLLAGMLLLELMRLCVMHLGLLHSAYAVFQAFAWQAACVTMTTTPYHPVGTSLQPVLPNMA
jgi:hypothetical protein